MEAPVLPAAVQLLGLEQVELLDAAKNMIGVEEHSMAIGPSTIRAAIKDAQPQKSLKATTHNDLGATKKKYEAEYIMGCDNNKFLIKWRGFDVATWEPMSNLDCPRLVTCRDFERLTAREKSRLNARTLTSETSNASLSSICSIHTTSIFLKRDLSEYPTGDIISAICKEFGLDPSEILLVWASPDCKTYSRADASNISRGNEYRNHNDPFSHPKTL